MKKLFLFISAFVFFGSYAKAQETDIRKERKRIKTEQRQMRQLGLNDNQGQELKRINSRYRDEHKLIMQSETLTQEQKQAEIQALNKRRVEEIHGVIGQDKVQEWDRVQLKEKEDKLIQENRIKEKKNKQSAKENKGKKAGKG